MGLCLEGEHGAPRTRLLTAVSVGQFWGSGTCVVGDKGQRALVSGPNSTAQDGGSAEEASAWEGNHDDAAAGHRD